MNNPNKKIYFASDFHLGVPCFEESLIREKKVVKWLDEIKHDAEEIFLVGDIFDFWFEYKRAVPRGFTRLLGKLSEITDSGIPVHVFTGHSHSCCCILPEPELQTAGQASGRKRHSDPHHAQVTRHQEASTAQRS